VKTLKETRTNQWLKLGQSNLGAAAIRTARLSRKHQILEQLIRSVIQQTVSIGQPCSPAGKQERQNPRKYLEISVPAGGIEPRPVIENTEVADSKNRQKR
jgi:hypothetical protein